MWLDFSFFPPKPNGTNHSHPQTTLMGGPFVALFYHED